MDECRQLSSEFTIWEKKSIPRLLSELIICNSLSQSNASGWQWSFPVASLLDLRYEHSANSLQIILFVLILSGVGQLPNDWSCRIGSVQFQIHAPSVPFAWKTPLSEFALVRIRFCLPGNFDVTCATFVSSMRDAQAPS